LKNKLIFKSGEPLPQLGNQSYRLTRITTTNNSIDGFRLNVVSYIGEVRSDVPILFSSMPDIVLLDTERKTATISVKLYLVDKTNVELILTPPPKVDEYEFVIDYDVL
jgi:hypothetical protein